MFMPYRVAKTAPTPGRVWVRAEMLLQGGWDLYNSWPEQVDLQQVAGERKPEVEGCILNA